jgi:hypothetical protein
MSRGTLREATRVGEASKVKGAFFVEFKKAEPAVPQNRGPLRMVFMRWGDGTPVKPRVRARLSEDHDL